MIRHKLLPHTLLLEGLQEEVNPYARRAVTTVLLNILTKYLNRVCEFIQQMKFGVRLPVSGPFASPDSIIQTAISAEDLGFDFVTAHDHLARNFEERYHFSVGTVESVDSSSQVTNFYESLSTFSFLAGMTKRIKLIPAALVLPVRNIPTIVKQVQTIQALSRNRLIFCVAVGNAEIDFEVTGADWKKRGEKLDEDLELIKLIFDSNRKPVSFEGKYTKFEGAEFSPPVSLPIWIAGKGTRALQRVAKHGSGWMPSGVTPEVLSATRLKLQRILEKHNRNISEVEICVETFVGIAKTSEEARRKYEPTFKKFSNLADISRLGSYTQVPLGSPDDIRDWVGKYREAGATYFEAKFYAASLGELLESMQLFSKEVIQNA